MAEKNNDGAAWWCKALAKGIGVIAAIACGICGLISAISVFAPLCIPAGIIMLVVAFIVILFEAPICCAYFEQTKKISAWVETRKYWQKGLLYIILSIIPITMCQSVTAIIGCLLTFAVGVIYGLMSLGKKGSQQEMRANAAGGDFETLPSEQN